MTGALQPGTAHATIMGAAKPEEEQGAVTAVPDDLTDDELTGTGRLRQHLTRRRR